MDRQGPARYLRLDDTTSAPRCCDATATRLRFRLHLRIVHAMLIVEVVLMTSRQISDVFHEAYSGSKNFMTPHVSQYRNIGPILVEYSQGRGFEGESIYGYTVILVKPARANTAESYHAERRHRISQLFHSRNARDSFHERLREKTKRFRRLNPVPRYFRTA